MAASQSLINRLRKLVQETDVSYEDDDLADILEQYPLTDMRGIDPFYYNTATNPPTQVATLGWIPSYDLHAAAAEIFDQRASEYAPHFDVTVVEPVPGTQSYSQRYDHYLALARYHNSRRSAQTAPLIMSPRRVLDDSYVINLAEIDEP